MFLHDFNKNEYLCRQINRNLWKSIIDPTPNEAFPNPKIPSLCFIKNVVKNPRIIIGDYTYYDDVDGADQFEKHVTHFYDFIGDRLIIGQILRYCQGCRVCHGMEPTIGMDGVTTYPFYVIGGDWEVPLLQ